MNDPSLPAGRQIRLFLVDGTPAGLMTAEVMNWTGKAIEQRATGKTYGDWRNAQLSV